MVIYLDNGDQICMSPNLEFLSILRPKHADFLNTMTPEEKEVMQQHRAYADQLFREGKIIFGGVAIDGSIGILVFRVDSAEEAGEIFEKDPAVVAGIGYPELHPFRIGMQAGVSP
jgi:uncharacterized protein YciI